ncbi:MAG: inner membrane CreD family protein [Paludibacteraceae bacterium]|nr:inner membrane CreD family protein [Paludibacteraceae bacterium]
METYALLAGSLGLFVILAVLMYLSQRINWSKAE